MPMNQLLGAVASQQASNDFRSPQLNWGAWYLFRVVAWLPGENPTTRWLSTEVLSQPGIVQPEQRVCQAVEEAEKWRSDLLGTRLEWGNGTFVPKDVHHV